MGAERLQKVLASAGIASRRDCEELIASGRVTVNGRVMHELGARVDIAVDTIEVDGKPIQPPGERTYIMLHKPVGVVSTADDPQGRPTVVELVESNARLFPVGRLDVDSEGLILLTDDGELTHKLTHPSFEVEKEYRALLNEAPSGDALRQWREGVMLYGERTAPAWVEVLEPAEQGVWVRVVIREGRKRQIREVAKLLGYQVLRLQRIREDTLLLGDLPLGSWRHLTPEEVKALQDHVAEISRTTSRLARANRRNEEESDEVKERPSRPAQPKYIDETDEPEDGIVRPQRGEQREFRPRTPYGERSGRDFDRNNRSDFRSDRRDERGSRSDRRDERGSRSDRRDERGFRGERNDRGFDRRDERGFDRRNDRAFRGERNDRGFERRDDRGFRGERGSDRGFERRDDRAFRGERGSDRGFERRDDRGFRGERGNDRGFERRDDRGFRGERGSDRGFERRDDRGFRGERGSDRGFERRDDRGFRGERGSDRGFERRDDRGFRGEQRPERSEPRSDSRSDSHLASRSPRIARGSFRNPIAGRPAFPLRRRSGRPSDDEE